MTCIANHIGDTMIDLNDQLELESLMITEGINRYRKQLLESVQSNTETANAPQRFFMVQAIAPLSAAIKSLVQDTYNGKPGKKSLAVSYLRDADEDVVAYITAKTVINGISSETTLTNLATHIGNQIEDHLIFKKFKDHNPQFFKRAVKRTAKETLAHRQRKCMKLYSSLASIEGERFKSDTKLSLGSALIHLFETETGLIEIKNMGVSRPPLVKASPKAMARLGELHTRCELMTPVFMPMIIKPQEWSSPFNGGYVTHRLPMIKTRNKAYLEELKSVEMPKVYRAINALQNTPWRVNKRVHEVLAEMWEKGSTLAGLPDRDAEPLNPLPGGLPADATKEMTAAYRKDFPEEWEQFKATRKKIHANNVRKQSKRVAVLKIITTADRLRKYEEFWFPYQMDWRGRMYPVVGTLNPQGQDAAKGLLEFAEGKPLGESGVTWLQIHLANCYGIDKVSYEDRMTWTLLNEQAILDSAIDPLRNTFWMDADGGGKAWQFLAACFAYADYKEHGAEYPCHLPVGLDGSCNGLQHLSSMILDGYGAANTNLVDSEKPADIYQIVANAVAAEVAEDAKNGHREALQWHGKVTRSVVKRNVMTVSYGATRFGMLEQLKEDLHKATDGKLHQFLGIDSHEPDFPFLKYLSELIIKHIGTTVRAAPMVMGWLQDVAHTITANGLPVKWTTPVGLPVMQSYRKRRERRMDTTLGGFRIQLRLREDTNFQDTKRAVLGVSPNYVHSMDGAHLQETVNRMLDAGVTGFAMVHDSYGTHACDVQEMAILLRESFVDMYQEDQLMRFREEIRLQLPEDLAQKLPKTLPRGDFDLEQVKEAMYFFA